jgi:4-amino-4-deoxy-L-arabinose transferase-like glycosyltransferase
VVAEDPGMTLTMPRPTATGDATAPVDTTAPAGAGETPRWVRPALAGLLIATGLLYLWGLGASGWANAFYSAAAQAGSQSWKAFFYGSSDAANSITVDKTPAALWVTALSVRLFGLNAWSILVPQALEGVAAVGLLYATVRRWFSPAAGLLAGAALAATPVATLMFRFNNPDALLVLLLVSAAYATVRAIERGSTRWLALAGGLVGLGFLTKMLQSLLVVPALAVAYLAAAPGSVLRRLGQLLIAGAAMVVAGGWWVAVVELVPASARPYIGGSQTNSVLELALGYNGLGRLTGEEVGSVGGGPGRGWGQAGLGRLFDAENGGQIAWLLPAALILFGFGLAVRWRAPRTDRGRAAYLIWGGWLLVTGVVFSLMAGIFHAYYSVALAPAVGALVGMGGADLWRRRAHRVVPMVMAGTVAVTAGWAWILLGRSPEWQPWLRPAVLVLGLAAAAVLALPARLAHPAMLGRLTAPAAVAGVAVALAGPLGYSLNTAATPHAGAIPTAGPAVSGAGFGGPGGLPGGARGPGGMAGLPGGRGFAFGGAAPGNGTAVGPGTGLTVGPGAGLTAGPGGGLAGGPSRGGMGNLLNATTPGSVLLALLRQDANSYTWAAATIGSNNASGYQLASGRPVMPVGGFNGSDPSPTLSQFQEYVRGGRIHYFIRGGGGRGGSASNGGSRSAQEIAAWVAANFTATIVDGATVYDLSSAAGR